jgi:hypothetical protein
MTDLFRRFLNGVSARGGYCLDCLSEIYGEPGQGGHRILERDGAIRPSRHVRQLRRGPEDLSHRSAFLARQSSARTAHHFPTAG